MAEDVRRLVYSHYKGIVDEANKKRDALIVEINRMIRNEDQNRIRNGLPALTTQQKGYARNSVLGEFGIPAPLKMITFEDWQSQGGGTDILVRLYNGPAGDINNIINNRLPDISQSLTDQFLKLPTDVVEDGGGEGGGEAPEGETDEEFNIRKQAALDKAYEQLGPYAGAAREIGKTLS